MAINPDIESRKSPVAPNGLASGVKNHVEKAGEDIAKPIRDAADKTEKISE